MRRFGPDLFPHPAQARREHERNEKQDGDPELAAEEQRQGDYAHPDEKKISETAARRVRVMLTVCVVCHHGLPPFDSVPDEMVHPACDLLAIRMPARIEAVSA
jgi:hypothetical protein